MHVDEVRKQVEGIPHMSPASAKVMTDVILDNQFQDILELGFRHGVSTCYMAGALEELGKGHITTIDRLNAQTAKPNVDELLGRLGLAKYVTVFYEPTSYIWRLMKMLEEDPSPRFDFCFIDGAHDWFTDGFAFFLVDRLLKQNGLIIFDDLDWTFESSPTLRETDRVRRMPQDEKSTPQVRKVYELLVKPHPSYGEFRQEGDWAYARKTSTESKGGSVEVIREVVYEKQIVYQPEGLAAAIRAFVRNIAK